MRRAALAAALWRPAHRSLAAVLEEAPALSDEDWKSGLEDQSSYGALSNGSGTYDFDDLGEQFDVGHLLELDSAGMDSESYDGDDQGRSEDEAYNHREPIVNLLPEQRLQKHRQSYEADIVVKLSMTDMLRTGKVLGLKLNVDTDFQPVVIKKVKKKGLAQDWNEANPRNQIHVGDEIVRVNDITWHHNSKTFVQRIKGQYLAARHKTAGASPFLALYIQRPRIDKRNRTHMQREDMHHKEYALDYVATLSMPGDSISANMLEGMGWTLGSQNNKSWHPLTILDIFSDGAIANYNEHHPNSLICPGDEIVGINNISWHENSTRFLGRLESQYQRSRSTPAGHARSFELSFRRPRDVQEMFDAAFPVVEKVRWDTDDIKVALQVPAAKSNDALTKVVGWQLIGLDEKTPPVIEKIRAEGMIANFNAAFPSQALQVGDRIVRVNDIRWHNNTQAFMTRIAGQLEASLAQVPGASRHLALRAQRLRRTVTEIRPPVRLPLNNFGGSSSARVAFYRGQRAPRQAATRGAPGAGGAALRGSADRGQEAAEVFQKAVAAYEAKIFQETVEAYEDPGANDDGVIGASE